MNGLVTYTPTGSSNNIIFGMHNKAITGAGIASFLFVSALGSSANLTPIVEPNLTMKQINITSGLLTNEDNKPLNDEEETNLMSFSVFNPSRMEYDNNKRVGTVLLNGSLLEGEYSMKYDRKGFNDNNQSVLVGNLDYIGKIPVNNRIDNLEFYSVELKDTDDYNEFKSLKGNLEFIGHIPKKPRI